MKIFKITTKKEREGKKATWPEIGVIFQDDNGQMGGYLNNAPNQKIYLFEQQPREQAPQGQPAPDTSFEPY